jgi:hypothetical protein
MTIGERDGSVARHRPRHHLRGLREHRSPARNAAIEDVACVEGSQSVQGSALLPGGDTVSVLAHLGGDGRPESLG